MGSDESHFNVSVGSDGQSHTTVSTNYNPFEEKGEPKRYQTEVLPLTSLKPYHSAKPAHNVEYGLVWPSGNDGLASRQRFRSRQEGCSSL